MWIQIDVTGELTGNIGAILSYGNFTPPENVDNIYIDENNHSFETETYTADPSGDYNPNNWSPII